MKLFSITIAFFLASLPNIVEGRIQTTEQRLQQQQQKQQLVSPDPDEENHASGVFMNGEYHGPTLQKIIYFHLDMPMHSQNEQMPNTYHHHCIVLLYK